MCTCNYKEMCTCNHEETVFYCNVIDIIFSEYGIYVDSNPGFDYDTLANYPLTVVCNDGSENSNTGTFYVYLVENQTPVIHNLQGDFFIMIPP